jgi:hypothetical protein
VLAGGCGKSANEDGKYGQNGGNPIPDPGTECDSENTIRWQFVQPEPVVSHSVDVLFVVDTSTSILDKRCKIAENIPAFLDKLPQGADYRIAVMEAHGGESDWTGKLWAPKNVPPVLSSQSLAQSQVQDYLKQSLHDSVTDPGPSQGEAGMYSFMRSLGADRLPDIQAAGFYRPDAALALFFITDENDICYRPELHGYTKWPDYVRNLSGNEVKAWSKYCLNADGSDKITPESVLASVSMFKGALPFAIGGIVHVDPKKVPIIGEDAIGHGILELLGLAGPDRSKAIEITAKSYEQGLSEMADLSHLISRLQADFDLSAHDGYDPATIKVQIDGYPVTSHFEAATHSVHVDGANLGHANSVIDVRACRPGTTNPNN